MRLLSLLALSLAASACAFTEDHVHLNYTQQAGVTRLAGAEQVTTTVKVHDARNDPSKVSAKKNGFGMEMAAIRTDEEAAKTVQAAIESELRARGFQVLPQGAVNVSIEITRLWNDFKMGVFAGDSVSEIALSAQVTSANGAIKYAKTFQAEGVEQNIQLASGSNAKLALDRAIEAGIRKLLADPAFFEALLKQPTS